MRYIYKTTDGKLYAVFAKDADRARCAAKRAALAAGSNWIKAKLVKIENALKGHFQGRQIAQTYLARFVQSAYLTFCLSCGIL